jgi:hypothetical protein
VPQDRQANTLGGRKEAIVADLDEAIGQDMLQKTVNKIFYAQRTPFFCISLGGAITEGDPVTFQL